MLIVLKKVKRSFSIFKKYDFDEGVKKEESLLGSRGEGDVSDKESFRGIKKMEMKVSL